MITKAEFFHEYLKNFIITRLRAYAREKSEENLGKLSIVQIEFDFHRTELLNQLAKRGEAIKSQVFKKKKTTDQDPEELVEGT